jgi:HEAT repeat protein
VFNLYRDSHSRVEILRALAVLGKGNAGMVENLNQYLVDQTSYYLSGMVPDYPTLRACIGALAAIGNDSTYPELFSAFLASFPGSLGGEITEAMGSIEGDYLRFLVELIRRNGAVEKLAAFRLGSENPGFSPAEKGELAETALEVSLGLFPGNSEAGGGSGAGWAAASALRYESVLALGELKWTRASPLVIRHFYRVQTDLGNGAAPKERLLEAVNCLGAMGNSESAQVLALQLGYINSQAERGGAYDEDLILALIHALGEIGDKAAFDHLLYMEYINYPERIQAAARESLNRLKW